MNYLQLCKAVRQECGIQGSGPAAVTNQTGLLKRVVEWVQDADNIIQTLYPDWNFLWSEFTEDTVEGSADVTKPDDFGQWDVESFGVDRGTDSGRSLEVSDYKDWRKNFSAKTNQPPSRITILPDQNLRLYAPADGIYEIYANYWKTPILLTEDTDLPPYPARFHRAIVARAKMLWFEDQEAWDNYKLAEVEFNQWMVELTGFALPGQQESNKGQPAPMTVRPE